MRVPAVGRRAGPARPRGPDGPPEAGEAAQGEGRHRRLGLDPEGNDLDDLAAKLKARCGTGGTVKDGSIELQGDHMAAAEAALKAIGYKVRRG